MLVRPGGSVTRAKQRLVAALFNIAGTQSACACFYAIITPVYTLYILFDLPLTLIVVDRSFNCFLPLSSIIIAGKLRWIR
jgi:hypothetical protein